MSQQFGVPIKEHKSAYRPQGENSLVVLHRLTNGHDLDWDRATVAGKGTSKYKGEFIEAWNTTSTCVNQSMQIEPRFKALLDDWRGRTR